MFRSVQVFANGDPITTAVLFRVGLMASSTIKRAQSSLANKILKDLSLCFSFCTLSVRTAMANPVAELKKVGAAKLEIFFFDIYFVSLTYENSLYKKLLFRKKNTCFLTNNIYLQSSWKLFGENHLYNNKYQ